MFKELRKRFSPTSLITIAHAVSEKEQITANVYFKSVDEIHAIENNVRAVINRVEADFKQALKEAQAEIEKEAARKAKKETK